MHQWNSYNWLRRNWHENVLESIKRFVPEYNDYTVIGTFGYLRNAGDRNEEESLIE